MKKMRNVKKLTFCLVKVNSVYDRHKGSWFMTEYKIIWHVKSEKLNLEATLLKGEISINILH